MHEWEAAQESLRAMHKRGIRILPGGDYGFAMTPHCQNARDLEFFVKYLGFTPMEAIRSATLYGGQIMMKPRRARPRQGRLPRRPAAGRRRPARQPLDPARPEADPRGDEGRRVRQGARDRRRARLGPGRMTRGLIDEPARALGALAAGRPADRRLLGLGAGRQPAPVPHDAAEQPDAGVALLHRRQRLHAGLRADAQRQPGARLALPARRLRRLHRRRAHRLVGAGGRRRLPRRRPSPGC